MEVINEFKIPEWTMEIHCDFCLADLKAGFDDIQYNGLHFKDNKKHNFFFFCPVCAKVISMRNGGGLPGPVYRECFKLAESADPGAFEAERALSAKQGDAPGSGDYYDPPEPEVNKTMDVDVGEGRRGRRTRRW